MSASAGWEGSRLRDVRDSDCKRRLLEVEQDLAIVVHSAERYIDAFRPSEPDAILRGCLNHDGRNWSQSANRSTVVIWPQCYGGARTSRLRMRQCRARSRNCHIPVHFVRGQFTEQERALADVQLNDAKVLPLRKPRGG